MAKKSFWEEIWASEETPWGGPDVDNLLFAHYEELKNKLGLGPSHKAFIPLCGNSKAVRFLYDKGHHVTALEFIHEAIESLTTTYFKELSFTTKKGKDCIIYEARKLRILEQDFFTFNQCNLFSFIYDRAALIAIHPEEQPKYADILQNSLESKGSIYLLSLDIKNAPNSYFKEGVKRSSIPNFKGCNSFLIPRINYFQYSTNIKLRESQSVLKNIRT